MKTIICDIKKSWYFLIFTTILISYCSRSNTEGTLTSIQAPQRYSCPYCDLSGKDFSGQDLSGANLSYAILTSANFSNATLKGAVLTGAKLQKANFQNAILGNAYQVNTKFMLADLSEADFTGATIESSNFQYADITCANFSNTDISKAIFGANPVFQERSDCQPVFKNAVLNCEFPWSWPALDLSEAKFPECNNVNVKTWTTEIDQARKNKEIAQWKGTKNLDSSYQKSRDLSGFSETYLVTNTGQDTDSCGSTDSPCRSIQYAINRCKGNNGAVLVQSVQFTISSTIQLKDGISLLGGYNEDGTSSVYQSSIIVSPDVAVFAIWANNINTPTTIDAFILNGGTGKCDYESNAAGYATLSVKNSTGISLSYCHIIAGKGAQGPYLPANTDGPDGPDGQDGGEKTGGYGGQSIGNGGDGADANIGEIINGQWQCTAVHCIGEDGTPYSDFPVSVIARGAQQGSSGIYNGGPPISPFPGENGLDSHECSSGGKRSSNNLGNFNEDSGWKPSSGVSGDLLQGYPGGGGGGGAGGSIYCTQQSVTCYGTSGGGGGAPGEAGLPGSGGVQGGASFGIYLSNSTLTSAVDPDRKGSVEVVGGMGGIGGSGGKAGKSGKGGKGGAPGQVSKCSDGRRFRINCVLGAIGSKGGDGGSAGSSGGGAAGNGGPSIAIVSDSASHLVGSFIPFEGLGGKGGKGGEGGETFAPCMPQAGEDGITGFAATTYIY